MKQRMEQMDQPGRKLGRAWARDSAPAKR
jgi:hypothetical protein